MGGTWLLSRGLTLFRDSLIEHLGIVAVLGCWPTRLEICLARKEPSQIEFAKLKECQFEVASVGVVKVDRLLRIRISLCISSMFGMIRPLFSVL